jgi:ubiquinone/menaquinone biosynthesis C-methylase UbiE
VPQTTNYQKHISANPAQRFLIENFYKELIRILKPLKPDKVLDVGCGEGFTLIKLKQAKIGMTHEGIDNSDAALKLSKRLNPSLNIKKGNIYNLPYKDNAFDLLICTEVLEHLENPRKALSELSRVTGKNMLLSVPNEPFFIIANLLRGKHLRTLGNHPEHINHWTSKGFRKFLSENGLRVSVIRHPFPWTLVLVKKNKTKKAL